MSASGSAAILALRVFMLALTAAACGGTTEVESATDGTAAVDAEPTVEETETVEDALSPPVANR